MNDTSKNTAPCLYFPMEIVERELNGNILLILEAIKNGWQCVLGTKTSIYKNIEHFPAGTFFLKSVTAPDVNNMRMLKDHGHHVTCLDVEGLVYTSLEEFVSVRFCQDSLEEVEQLFFWGDIQRKAVEKAYPDQAGKMHTTGSPIADLWQRKELHAFYQEDVEKLQKRFGPYILIPSSFGGANHQMGREASREIMLRDKMIREEEQEEFFNFWTGYEDHIIGIFEKFLEFLPNLAKSFPDHEIIVRPHPSEAHEPWVKAAQDLPNVTVIFEGVVAPWLLGADAILHWGCTTALEGYLMGKPVVSYNPVTPEDEEKYDHKVPHYISIITRTEEDTVEALRHVIDRPDDILNDYPHVAKGLGTLREWICDVSDAPSTVAIMDYIQRLENAPCTLRDIPVKSKPLKEHIWTLLEVMTRYPKGLQDKLPERIKVGIKSRTYGRHKMRDINEENLRDAVAKLAEIKGLSDIQIQTLGKNIFQIGQNIS